MDFTEERKEFSRFCHILYQRHLVVGVGGNVALRVGEGVLITPSGINLRDQTPETAVLVDMNGKVSGEGRPSKEAGMHLRILAARPEVGAVCHVHGSYILAASAMLSPGESSLPPLTPGIVFFAYPLEMLPFMVPGSKELLDAASDRFSNPKKRALLLQNHGLITVGRDLTEAVNIAEEIDEAAMMYVLTGGKASTIPDDLVDKIF